MVNLRFHERERLQRVSELADEQTFAVLMVAKGRCESSISRWKPLQHANLPRSLTKRR